MTSQSQSTTVPAPGSSTSPAGLVGSNTTPVVPPTHAPPSDDPAWKYCHIPDMNKKSAVQCNFCYGVYIGGITQMKYHFANIKKESCTLCKLVPADVKQEMRELISKKDAAKEKKASDKAIRRSEVTLDGNDDRAADEDDILGGVGGGSDILLLSGKGKSKGSTYGAMDKFCIKTPEEVVAARKEKSLSVKLQSKLSTQRREERRIRACEYICQFFYEAGIAHNTVLLPSFENMLEAIGTFGSDMTGPTPYEMGGPYLKKSKQKAVDVAVNFFEPMANVLRRMDSDVPAMGFLYGCMLDAKKEISARFDNEKSRFLEVWDIIDKRWDDKLKTALHRAGYYLNPYYYYPNKRAIELDETFKEGLIICISKMIDDPIEQEEITDDIDNYNKEIGSFRRDIAVRQRKNKKFDPAKWWMNHGSSAGKLRVLAARILGLTCSSSACERNWSVFDQVHTKRRNRLLHDKMSDLVFIKFNTKLTDKKLKTIKDPIEKHVVDVLEDDDNEWVTGVVPNANEEQSEGEEQEEELPYASGQAGPSTSTTNPILKRKRGIHAKKKKKMIPVTPHEDLLSASSASESDDDDVHNDDNGMTSGSDM